LSTRRYAAALWVLTGLFAFRVMAQPAALVFDGLLPSFNSWDGGVMPYPVLLVTQIVILGWLARTAWRFSTGTIVPRRQMGRAALTFGGVYFAVMFLRLLLGATALSHVRWFASPLPAVFHLVLATYLLLYGYCHVHTVSRNASR
jgi:hypothetical protein